MTLSFIRCDHANILLIKVLLIFENVFYLEKSVLSCVIFHLKFFICRLFRLANTFLSTVSYSNLYMGCWNVVC